MNTVIRYAGALALMTFTTALMADSLIRLKDGSMITGVIIERDIVSEVYKVKTSDNKIVAVRESKIERVSAAKSPTPKLTTAIENTLQSPFVASGAPHLRAAAHNNVRIDVLPMLGRSQITFGNHVALRTTHHYDQLRHGGEKNRPSKQRTHLLLSSNIRQGGLNLFIGGGGFASSSDLLCGPGSRCQSDSRAMPANGGLKVTGWSYTAGIGYNWKTLSLQYATHYDQVTSTPGWEPHVDHSVGLTLRF